MTKHKLTTDVDDKCDPPSKFYCMYNCKHHKILYLLGGSDPEIVCTNPSLVDQQEEENVR